jgi:hypothetical protein
MRLVNHSGLCPVWILIRKEVGKLTFFWDSIIQSFACGGFTMSLFFYYFDIFIVVILMNWCSGKLRGLGFRAVLQHSKLVIFVPFNIYPFHT